ncbi:MAG: M48 family metalloprotease, partial [Pirellulaceae bacterium]|nr:M48 family metalloprotease [Pirellulaceae bacterium]
QALEWIWLVLQAWLLPASGLAQILSEAHACGWPNSLLIVAWFLPSLIFISALEWSYAQLETHWTSHQPQGASTLLRERWWQRIRFGSVGAIMTCLVPGVLVLGFMDTIQAWWPAMPERWQAIGSILALGLVSLTLAPLWLKIWNGARPFDRESIVPQRVHEFCQLLKLPVPEVLRVGDKQVWHGAALVGWTPLFRQLWVGDALVKQLSPQQLDMVLLHELAHLRRGHCWWRLVPLVLCASSIVVMASTPALLWTSSDSKATIWAIDSLGAVPLLLVGLGIIWLLGWISRACELDADLDACRQARLCCAWAAHQPQRAVDELSSALISLHEGLDQRRGFWLHPSVNRRVSHIARSTNSSSLGGESDASRSDSSTGQL